MTAIDFAIGVATSVPMEFQFGTNWAAFSKAAGGVIGQTLAMERMFSFFLESSFLGLFLFGEKRLGRMGHWLSAFLILLDTIFSERQNLRRGAPLPLKCPPAEAGLARCDSGSLEPFWSCEAHYGLS